MAEISIDISLKIPFLSLRSLKIKFVNCHIHWKTYTIAKVLLIMRQIKLIRLKEIAATILDIEDEAFIVHIAFISQELDIYPSSKIQIASFKADETSTSLSLKYADLVNVFSKDLIAKLLKHIKINDHIINWIKDDQPPYNPIYSLTSVEFGILKTYIKTNLGNSFI